MTWNDRHSLCHVGKDLLSWFPWCLIGVLVRLTLVLLSKLILCTNRYFFKFNRRFTYWSFLTLTNHWSCEKLVRPSLKYHSNSSVWDEVKFEFYSELISNTSCKASGASRWALYLLVNKEDCCIFVTSDLVF